MLLTVCEKYSPAICCEKEVYKILMTYKNKRAEVIWPSKLREVFFDFWDSEERIFSDSVEFYSKDEPITNMPIYIGNVLTNFFEHQTRLQQSGGWLKIEELLFEKDGRWQTVF